MMMTRVRADHMVRYEPSHLARSGCSCLAEFGGMYVHGPPPVVISPAAIRVRHMSFGHNSSQI
jgi:hypothetical protein